MFMFRSLAITAITFFFQFLAYSTDKDTTPLILGLIGTGFLFTFGAIENVKNEGK